MKRLLALIPILILSAAAQAQMPAVQIEGEVVARNDDVVFRRIDAHTWVGTGKLMANESLYLVEGENKAVLIDAGTKIADLDKIVASITKKPVMLVATHAHPDHTGAAINSFAELYINPADAGSQFVSHYKGKLKDLNDGQIIDLGGRQLLVVFTPAHTPGSTTFIDTAAGYGFSGDSFGSGNLLLFGKFSTLIETCRKTSALMEKHRIKFFYPGHFMGKNVETKQRVDDELTLSQDILSGKVKGQENPRARMGMNLIVSAYGVRINYSEQAFE
ncbi:MAG: MBL fold metallo-hydrolase [Bryobacteraceae bacterium]|nr:MBL fold metallo-hydrolase [Bryobacteraceae bacterium]